MTPIYRFALLSGVLVSLSACATGQGVDHAAITRAQEQLAKPYFVNVSNIVVENKYNPLANAKDVSSTLPTPLDTSLKNYAEQRFRPAGGEGILHFVIRDASVFMDHRNSSIPAAKWAGIDDKDKYTAVVKIGLERDASMPASIGAMGTELKAERSVTMPAGISLNERDARLQEFTTDLLNDIDHASTDSILNALKLSAPDDIAPSPGAHPPTPVDAIPLNR
jgi:hypothetical protein